VSITFGSKYPDEFQNNHALVSYADPDAILPTFDTSLVREFQPMAEEEREEVHAYLDSVNMNTEGPELMVDLKPKTIHIKEGDTGFSYKKLFGPYLQGAREVYIADPYVRFEYQIRNFISFAGILDTSNGKVKLKLATTAEDDYQEKVLTQKFQEIKTSLAQHNIAFFFEFNPALHDRSIKLDNGWNIYPGRGLDIYQKPESKYELSEIDQTKRKCKQTEIVFMKVGG
jgi:ATP-dependent Lon protease